MKKLISSIIFTIILSTCFSLTVYAQTSITIAEDYQTMALDGKTYSCVNTSLFETECYDELTRPVDLSPTQEENIQAIYFRTDESQTFIFAQVNFINGATLSIYFLQDDYLEDYDKIISGERKNYVVDYKWPEGNTVYTNKIGLLGTAATLTDSEIEWSDYFFVTSQNEDGSLVATAGVLILFEDTYYYVDFLENSITSSYDFYDYSELRAYEITNQKLLSDLKDAEEKYYADDFGFLLNANLGQTISSVFIFLIFAFLPLASFILFLILAIRSKTVYRKFFRTISLLSLTELIVFGAIMILITVL